jgi:hypothetical protein
VRTRDENIVELNGNMQSTPESFGVPCGLNEHEGKV